MEAPALDTIVELLDETADRVRTTLGGLDDWGPARTRPGQHLSDLAADAVAVDALVAAGLGVLSEESGTHHLDREVVVVVDPLDGSTNAAQGIPWYATSFCAVDRDGPLCALVVDLVHGRRYRAVRGGGARRDGEPIAPSAVTGAEAAVIGISGHPPRPLGWAQFRALGAIALDLCAVADGTLDGYVDCSVDAHGPWDYLGALLVCREAGAVVTDHHDRELVDLDPACRRTPVAGATPDLHRALVTARSSY